MNKLDKIKLAISKGITCSPELGIVYGVRGNEIKGKIKNYTVISFLHQKKIYRLAAHQFIYYWVYNEVVDIIDHINRNTLDNRISNLRSATHSKNMLNTNSKGYYFSKVAKKWLAQIQVDKKYKYLGLYKTEAEASNAYITEKQKYILCSEQKVN
jgi:hypothetical protein